jgi:hypothetical protein
MSGTELNTYLISFSGYDHEVEGQAIVTAISKLAARVIFKKTFSDINLSEYADTSYGNIITVRELDLAIPAVIIIDHGVHG